MSGAIFVGPSLSPHFTLKATPQLAFYPPARKGDIALAAESHRHILLIDGLMIYDYPPSPREIVSVLEEGTSVWGAASLGALRAVELGALGMQGFGWVFDAFRTGKVNADDELLCLLDRDFQALTVPLINVRYGIECAAATDTSARDWGYEALTSLRKVYFEDRTVECVEKILTEHGCSERLLLRILSPTSNIKRKDALAAIRLFANLVTDER